MTTPTDYARGYADGLERAAALLDATSDAAMSTAESCVTFGGGDGGRSERFRAQAAAYRMAANFVRSMSTSSHPDPQEPR